MAKIVNPYIVLVKGGEPTPPTTEGKYLVQVIDYDGTVLKSAKLNTGDTFTLPDAPTSRPRLAFQEWASPVTITNNTITVENSDITIGATYTTTSGLTEFDITLTEVTGLTVTCNMEGNKNWGDGTSDATTSHTYSATGDYTITCDGTTIPAYVMGQTENNYILTNARISSGVTSIEGEAFSSNINLMSITIPNSVTSLGAYAFWNCYSLTSITIPSSITFIYGSTFVSNFHLKSITIPSSITRIINNAFGGSYSLTSVTIPSGVTSIDEKVFSELFSLTSISIPNGVTSIKNFAFWNCYSLTSITIPTSVTIINQSAFAGCYSITEYDFSACTSVPTLSSTTAFNHINHICKMLIPSALIDTWKTATNWSTYAKYMVAV